MVREELTTRALVSMIVGLSALFITAMAYAAPPPRHALIIGNSAYRTGPLRNPSNDASDMAETLKKLGFEVDLLRNVSLREMEEALNRFSRRLRQGGLGLFYFAGHGIQVQGENYLIPLEALVERAQDARYEALPVGRVLGAMEDAGNRLNIVILDACRNNPFARSWRSRHRGLAVVQAAQGSLIAYATSPGRVAADGDGRNGVYTQHLLKLMTQPGLRVERLFKQVRVAVMKETNRQQIPWESSSLTGDIYLAPRVETLEPAPAPTPPPAPAVPDNSKAEAEMWNLIKASNHPEDIEFFLQTFPKGQFAPVARLKLQQLKRKQRTALENRKQEKTKQLEQQKLADERKRQQQEKERQAQEQQLREQEKKRREQEKKQLAAQQAKKEQAQREREAAEARRRQEARRKADQTARLEPSPKQSKSPKKIGQFLLYDQPITLDTTTSLMWMTEDFRTMKRRGVRNWSEAEAFAYEMNQQRFGGYNNWRVPTIEEYRTIYDASKPSLSYKGRPMGYSKVFRDGGGRWFWSSIVLEPELNSQDDTRDDALVLDFATGSVNQEHRDTSLLSVRLVRIHK